MFNITAHVAAWEFNFILLTTRAQNGLFAGTIDTDNVIWGQEKDVEARWAFFFKHLLIPCSYCLRWLRVQVFELALFSESAECTSADLPAIRQLANIQGVSDPLAPLGFFGDYELPQSTRCIGLW